MDYTGVPAPSNYGAPNVFQAPQGQQQGQGQQQSQQTGSQISQVLQKAKLLMSQGLISPDQYNQIELQTSGGNMGSNMGAGAPMNITPSAPSQG